MIGASAVVVESVDIASRIGSECLHRAGCTPFAAWMILRCPVCAIHVRQLRPVTAIPLVDVATSVTDINIIVAVKSVLDDHVGLLLSMVNAVIGVVGDVPSADQFAPSHFAMVLAATPPAVVNVPVA